MSNAKTKCDKLAKDFQKEIDLIKQSLQSKHPTEKATRSLNQTLSEYVETLSQINASQKEREKAEALYKKEKQNFEKVLSSANYY